MDITEHTVGIPTHQKDLLAQHNIQFIQGDMLEHVKLLEKESVHFIVADLPYGSTACAWDKIVEFSPMWEAFYHVLQDRRAIALHGTDHFASDLIQSNRHRFSFNYYWNKEFAGNFVQAKRMPLRVIEPIGIYAKDNEFKQARLPLYTPQMITRDVPIYQGGNKPAETIPARGPKHEERNHTRKRYDTKFPTNYLHYNVRKNRGWHPTPKPLELYLDLFKTFTQEGETILDPCMGSAPTAIVAAMLKRKYIGIELNSKYYKIAHERFFQHFSSTTPTNHNS